MATIQELIAASADDGYDDNYGSWNSTNTRVFQGGPYATGVRFQTVAIPQGASISSATLTFDRTVSPAGSTWGSLFGDDVDDAAAWGPGSYPGNLTRTSASVAVSGSDPAAHDVQSIVQEIVDRGGWSSGNNMRFAGNFVGNGYVTWRSYDSASSPEPTLDVTYVANVDGAGASAGAGAASGVGNSTADGVGAADGVASALAEGAASEGLGVSTGVASVSGSGASLAEATGAAAGSSTGFGEAGTGTGSAAATSSAAAFSKWIYSGTGIAAGAVTVAGIALPAGGEVINLTGIHVANIALDGSTRSAA